MKPINELRKLLRDSPLAGLTTRSRFYSISSNITLNNTLAPISSWITIPPSEYFWLTGIYGSYFRTTAPDVLDSPYIQLTNVMTQATIFKNSDNPAIPGFCRMQGNIEPGAISATFGATSWRLEGATECEHVLAPQQILRVDLLHPGVVGPLQVDVLFMGYSVKVAGR